MKFETYHPVINMLYFTAAAVFIILFDHPVFAAAGYLSVFICSAVLRGMKAVSLAFWLTPLIFVYTLIYMYHNNYGATVITHTYRGNNVTLEAMVYGLVTGTMAVTLIMLLSCLVHVMTADKIIYMTGRIMPAASAAAAVILRTAPRFAETFAKKNTARKGIGMGVPSGCIRRLPGLAAALVSACFTWLSETLIGISSSMKNRGAFRKGRTAFSIYRFDHRDRSAVLMMVFLITVTAVAHLLDQTRMFYDPQIVMNRVTPLSYAFYAAYCAFLIMPAVMQSISGISFRISIRRRFS